MSDVLTLAPDPIEVGNRDTREAVLSVRNLRKHFERSDGTRVPAIDGISFELHRGEFMVLLGPSGCGKTTLLRSVAGLERPQAGEVVVDGREVFASDRRLFLPPEKRGLSMVFQSYALWPHLTVFQNIAYPLRQGHTPRLRKQQIAEMVDRVMVTMQLSGLAKQYPNQLSGGQQQRVALSRALVGGSKLVLFDEPLSNIDAKVREQLRIELLLMQRELGFAALFVTHDQQEAMVLAHTIAVLDHGRVVQIGAPNDIYRAPHTAGAAAFLGAANQINGTVVATDHRTITLETSLGKVVGQAPEDTKLSVGAAAVALWRPEAFSLVDTSRASETMRGVINQSWLYGGQTESLIDIAGLQYRARITDGELLDSGTTVQVIIDPSKVFVYPESERSEK